MVKKNKRNLTFKGDTYAACYTYTHGKGKQYIYISNKSDEEAIDLLLAHDKGFHAMLIIESRVIAKEIV